MARGRGSVLAVAAIVAVVGVIVLIIGASGISTVPAITSRQQGLNLLGIQASQYYNQMIVGGVLIAAGFIGFVLGRAQR